MVASPDTAPGVIILHCSDYADHHTIVRCKYFVNVFFPYKIYIYFLCCLTDMKALKDQDMYLWSTIPFEYHVAEELSHYVKIHKKSSIQRKVVPQCSLKKSLILVFINIFLQYFFRLIFAIYLLHGGEIGRCRNILIQMSTGIFYLDIHGLLTGHLRIIVITQGNCFCFLSFT